MLLGAASLRASIQHASCCPPPPEAAVAAVQAQHTAAAVGRGGDYTSRCGPTSGVVGPTWSPQHSSCSSQSSKAARALRSKQNSPRDGCQYEGNEQKAPIQPPSARAGGLTVTAALKRQMRMCQMCRMCSDPSSSGASSRLPTG